ncbi:helix-turn-helix domain-containing protein [Paraburkholderia sediminicola]|uniref:helix-turn-helix domain-containing protein n=1 Tax=Paraburkholderia sediminicola TaxID=458836 RepID=UPI0038BD68F2
MQRQSQHASRWELVEDLTHHFQTSLDVPTSIMSVIAERIEQAISAPSELALKSLSADLLSLVRAAMRNSPKDAADAALAAPDGSVAAKAAHLLGQLGFAQLIAAQALARRAGDEFFELIDSARFRPYVELLREGEMRNTDIARRLGFEEETVSRVMKILRTEGVTDFRKKGRDVFNFLTPPAVAVAAEFPERAPERTSTEGAETLRVDLRQFAAVREATHQTPNYFLKRQTLVSSESLEAEAMP